MVHPIRHQVNSRVLHKGLFTDEQGRQLRERPAQAITRQRVLRLNVSHRRPRSGKQDGQT